MFANYSNLNQDYVPNNTKKDKWLKREFYKDNSYETIDELSNLYHRYKATDEGLEFTYVQEIKFDFDVDDIAYVEKDAIVSYVAGEEPTENTAGNLGQYFYNIADYKVWKCTSLGQTVYRWEQLERFSIPQTNVGQKVKLSEVNDAITCVVFDRRGEIVYQADIENNSRTIDISKEDSATYLIPGLYEFIFLVGEEFRACYNVVVKDTRSAFNKSINNTPVVFGQEESGSPLGLSGISYQGD